MALVVGNRRQALCWAALVTLVAPATAPSAALDLQQTPAGVAPLALQWVWPKLWLDLQQASGEAASLVIVASVAASLAALDPQLTPDGAALVALEVGIHRQALCWAALVTLVAPVAAPLAALGFQQTPAGVALACRQWHLGHQLVPPGTAPVDH